MPKNYYLSAYLPSEVSSSQIKKTILSETLTKEEKYADIKDHLEKETLIMLREFDYIWSLICFIKYWISRNLPINLKIENYSAAYLILISSI